MMDLKGDTGLGRAVLWCKPAPVDAVRGEVLCPAAGREQPFTLASSHSIVPPDLERWRKSIDPSLRAEMVGDRFSWH